MINKILVAVDGSEPATKALNLAIEFAHRFDAALHIVSVARRPQAAVMAVGPAAVSVAPDRRKSDQVTQRILAKAVEAAEATGARRVDGAMPKGDPAAAIVEEARSCKADMIVIGARGLSELEGLLLGSVSHKVIQLAPCSVLTVR